MDFYSKTTQHIQYVIWLKAKPNGYINKLLVGLKTKMSICSYEKFHFIFPRTLKYCPFCNAFYGRPKFDQIIHFDEKLMMHLCMMRPLETNKIGSSCLCNSFWYYFHGWHTFGRVYRLNTANQTHLSSVLLPH